ncbi:hypothetical protein [Burkholderia diffusa]|nr:hypothetical protein [Burkholderia diffusa]
MLGCHATMFALAGVLLVGKSVSIAWAPQTQRLMLVAAAGRGGVEAVMV